MGTVDRRRERFAYWLIAPAVLFMVLVHLIPTAAGTFLSLLNLNTFTFQQLFGAPWAGLENYESILFDTSNPLHSGFTNAVGNTAFYTAWTVGLTLLLGLAVALLLNRSFPGQRVVRTLMLTPWVVPSFVVASLWQFMWQRDAGIINKVLVDYLGIVDERPTWLLGENTMWAIIVPSVWRGIPFAMLIFLAGLQAIPRELHEAAAIDGAGAWQTFVHMTLPHVRRYLELSIVLGTIFIIQNFDSVLGMTGGLNSTNIPYAVYEVFYSAKDYGVASALGVVVVIGSILVATFALRVVSSLLSEEED
jgi:multiple sugar transport system permease protein